jgi:hypothetical protein
MGKSALMLNFAKNASRAVMPDTCNAWRKASSPSPPGPFQTKRESTMKHSKGEFDESNWVGSRTGLVLCRAQSSNR